jgi:poly-gamma-glutamate synthesis protein (capsule biosynthesis protein)
MLSNHSDGRFVFSSLDRSVYAYGGGARLWRARLSGPVYTSFPLDGGQVAAGDDAGMVTLLDSDGQKLWQHDVGSRVTALAFPLSDGLLAGGWDGWLTLLNPGPGEERVRWQVPLDSRVTGISLLPGGRAAVSTIAGDVRLFGNSGAMRWSFRAGAPVTRLRAYHEAERYVIFAGLQDGRLLALSADGKLLWQVYLGEGTPQSEVVHLNGQEGPVVLAATGGAAPTLSLLSMDGAWRWRLALPSPAGAVAALDLESDGESEILVGFESGELVAYDRTGMRRGSAEAGLPVSAIIAPGGWPEGTGSGLVLANLYAWRIAGGAGAAATPRLDVPKLVDSISEPLPSTAIPMAGGQGEREGAVLAFLGDVVPGRSMELQIERYGAGYPWRGLAPMLHDADLALANLECVLSTQGTALRKPYVIRAHPSAGHTLAAAGFDLVSLANNHTLDYGVGALEDTLAVVDSLDLMAVGAGRTVEEAYRPAIVELNGVRVAFLAYAGAYWQGSADMPVSDRIAWGDPAAVAEHVAAVREEADVVVVIVHAGKEYARKPSDSQVAVAHAAVDAGADLVVGHHPHVTQTVERYRGALIVYSLGNALFDIPLQAAMQGDLLRVQVSRHGLVQAELWPFWIDGEIQPRFLDDGQGQPRFRVIYP